MSERGLKCCDMNEGNVHENAVVFGCNWLQRDRGEGMAAGHKQTTVVTPGSSPQLSWLPQGFAPNYRGYTQTENTH